MDSSIIFRAGDEESLAYEFIQMKNAGLLKFEAVNFKNPDMLAEGDILAVHYACAGAQGDPGAVEILYRLRQGVQILYGNYAYGNLDYDALIRKLPLLTALDSRDRSSTPYPFGGSLDIPEGWGYMYMGALNHFFIRQEICNRASVFIKTLLENGGHSWQIFEAVAWFCGAQHTL